MRNKNKKNKFVSNILFFFQKQQKTRESENM